MAIESQTAEMIGNIIGGLVFYGLLCFIVYYIVRFAMRHEREKQKIIEIKERESNGKYKR